MNKEALECKPNLYGSAAAPIGLCLSKVQLQGSDDDDALDQAGWFQDSYLQALDGLVKERIRLCSQTLEHVHTHERRYATRPADQHQADSDARSVQDPVLASIESRLRSWLTAGSMPGRQQLKTGTELLELSPVEMMIASPPINRRHMPTAKFEFNFTERMKYTKVNALTTARSLTVLTFRRLLLKM